MLQRLRDLSFVYKIPLRASVLLVGASLLLTASLIAREYEEARKDLLAHAGSVARLLATTLAGPILHDDVWRAFEIINAPFQPNAEAAARAGELVLVLDPRRQVYVSTRPRQFPVLSDPGSSDPEFGALQDAVARYSSPEPGPVELPNSRRIYVVAPILSDGALLGTLVMGYDTAMFLPRLYAIAIRAGVVTLLVLAVVMPVSWYWGRRMAAPLVELAADMAKVGTQPAADIEPEFRYQSRDEIGRAGAAFRRMVGELREKEALEKEVLVSERLAAVGRLSAGIAHEINNPLGGMLNAISTFRRHGEDSAAMAAKTISLLERGLLQIKETVAALLVEARLESRRLTPQDIQDTHTLALAAAAREGLRFTWENDIIEPLPLPSTLVRQVLINLQLNAIQATSPPGEVYCHVFRERERFHVRIRNDGRHIPPEQLDYLFEPFQHFREGGTGLGLWVTYQIVRQLGGEISVESEPGQTSFAIQVPLPEAA